MLQYYYRIFDKFNKQIVAFALYTDGNSKFKPNEYSNNFYGTEIIYRFNTYKVLDKKDNVEELKKSSNPFALVILASLYYLESKKDENKRYNFKIELTKLLFEKGYKKEDIWELFDFIDILVNFKNEKLEVKYVEEIEKMPKTKEKMPIGGYKKIIMKLAREEGLKKGREEGIEEGIEEGKTKKSISIAKNLKENGIDIEIIVKSTGLSREEVEKL